MLLNLFICCLFFEVVSWHFAQASLEILGLSSLPASACGVARNTGMCHYTWFICIILLSIILLEKKLWVIYYLNFCIFDKVSPLYWKNNFGLLYFLDIHCTALNCAWEKSGWGILSFLSALYPLAFLPHS